jgi:hypothetical protein
VLLLSESISRGVYLGDPSEMLRGLGDRAASLYTQVGALEAGRALGMRAEPELRLSPALLEGIKRLPKAVREQIVAEMLRMYNMYNPQEWQAIASVLFALFADPASAGTSVAAIFGPGLPGLAAFGCVEEIPQG